ncbi:N-glycosylation protein-domain-containing protein [Amanita rubescens]|nr:N-glycosylation protein-domain-containing protein [Amanita rubescens]
MVHVPFTLHGVTTENLPPPAATTFPTTSTSTVTNTSGLRSRFLNGLKKTLGSTPRSKVKSISTTPGQLCLGETETEADEPPRGRLPTARIVRSSGPLIPPNNLQQQLTPLLFEFSRLLSIVPAIVGTIYNLYHVLYPPHHQATSSNSTRNPPERIDYFVSTLWAILTGYQCLALTTGLLTRWRLYYPPLSTLIRLLALQGICWPATQITLSVFEHEKRPVVVWALIGTTTCASRSVQIWVTSNLWWDGGGHGSSDSGEGESGGDEPRRGYWKRWGGKWGGRRWDWKEVSIKCVLPAGIMYFVMAWAEQLRREWGTK